MRSDNKNGIEEELTKAISYAKKVEEILKIEREINEFAVQTKYDLVSLIDVSTRVLTVYKKGEIFEKGGLQTEVDYDKAAKFVCENLVYADDHENFKRLFFDNLIKELFEKKEVVIEYRFLGTNMEEPRWKRVQYCYFQNTKDIIIQLTEDIHEDMLIKLELEAKNEKLSLDEKCFKALSEQTNKVILEWNFATNSITAMSNFQALFGRKAITVNKADDALSVNAVHEEDRAVFSEVFETIRSGNPVEDARFRIIDKEGVYHWCSLSGLVIKDNKGKPFKAIGALENIEEQLNREAELRHKAEIDQLTGLYNKGATEKLIKDILRNPNYKMHRCALMIIDLDNFKDINDQLGHLYGDAVLAEISDEYRALFRTTDIIGRVGGDEFVAMLVDFKENELLVKKATDICRIFRKTYSSGRTMVKTSASVGIAIVPEHGEDYESLFRNAELALYDTKAKGKNGFCFYEGQQSINYQSSRTEIDTQGGMQKNFKENRMEYIFKLLYESDNEGRNIESTLQFITERFGFSRGYVFEVDSTGAYINNTVEWCADNITREISNMQQIPIDIPQMAIMAFKEKGVFIIEDVNQLEKSDREDLERQNIKAMFQFGIMEKGEAIGFIGFDDCIRTRVLTKEQIEELKLICHMLGTFLNKQRTAEMAQSNYNAILSIFNNFEGFSYVVEKDTYKVLFENANVRTVIRNTSVGKCCYQAYMNQSTPCEECPIRGLSNQVIRNAVEINNRALGVISRATASKINWIDGQKNYLVSCIDITEYRK